MTEQTRSSLRQRLLFLLFTVILPTGLLGLLVLTAVSPIPMRGAEVFGRIANKIKGNPGATAYWTLFALSMLWVGIGLLAAIQEWRAGRPRAS